MWLNNPQQVTALIVDGANTYQACKAIGGGFMLDYAKVLSFFKPRQAMYLTALPERNLDIPNNIFKMIDYINFNGYTIIQKPMKIINGVDVKREGNMDVEIALSIIHCAKWANHIVLFSGDGDFRPAIEYVQMHHGVTATVVSALKTQPAPIVADELRRQANQFYDLCDGAFKEKVGMDRNERRTKFLEGQ
jgi:uncharacterized LabA/DUF88 family protein